MELDSVPEVKFINVFYRDRLLFQSPVTYYNEQGKLDEEFIIYAYPFGEVALIRGRQTGSKGGDYWGDSPSGEIPFR
jgi:hypothetical protein